MKRGSITFWRVIRTGFINFVRNAWLAVAAIAVMVVTLTIVLFSIVTNATFNNTIAQIADKINVSVYLKDSVTKDQLNTFMSQLRILPNVKKVSYVSKDQALAEYKVQNAGNKDLLQAINETGNPLPASIQIDPVDPSKIQAIKNFLDQPANVALEDPQVATSYSGDRKAAIDKIASATNVLKRVGIVAILVFAFVSMIIIFNTIQMAIFNRRSELTIMRLLGASTWFIRGPFVVESIIYGICAALISVGIIDTLFVVSSSALQASSLGLLDIGYANTYFHAHFLQFLTLQLCVGIVIGAASSIIATRRYLKFKSSVK